MQGNNSNLKNLIIYEIYVRNHGPNGNISDVIKDLERIKFMGVDIIWLMPIYPIGKKNKKGTLGCPYSIQDYREINPEYGTLQDFQNLISAAHQFDLKIMLDIVFNHTSCDSTLVNNHPEYFHQDKHGNPITTVPAWSDVIDLKYPNDELEKYLIDTLCYWVEMGVDGFRCDVASIIPLPFWLEAKGQVEAINPNFIWLAESVETGWVIERRRHGLTAHADAELYRAFDLTYNYDVWSLFKAAVSGILPVERYLEMIEYQKGTYPHDYIKMRCVENHDNLRIMAFAQNENIAQAWTAFEVFLPGAFLIYAGQESASKKTPSLFDIDKVKWGDYSLQNWLTRLFQIKKSKIFTKGNHYFLAAKPAIQSIWIDQDVVFYNIFNINDVKEPITCQLSDGLYEDLISQEYFQISNGKLDLNGASALIFKVSPSLEFTTMRFKLLEHFDD